MDRCADWRLTQCGEAQGFFEIVRNDFVHVYARVTPGAAKDEITGVWRGAEGEQRLAVKVTAPPDKGKANAAICKLVSKTLGLPKSAVSIMAGETSRLKTVALAGDTGVIVAAIKRLTGETE